MEICPRCGLPKDLCICKEISKEEQEIRVTSEKRKFGKITTLISGFDKNVDVKDIAKQLKRKLACGGTVKNGIIELQGDHKKKIKEALVELGFKEEQIK